MIVNDLFFSCFFESKKFNFSILNFDAKLSKIKKNKIRLKTSDANCFDSRMIEFQNVDEKMKRSKNVDAKNAKSFDVVKTI